MSSKKGSYPWSPEEENRLYDLLKDHSFNATTQLINREFHEGEDIRTYHSVRAKYRKHGDPMQDRFKTVRTSSHNLPEFERTDIPKELQPVEDLIEERIVKYDLLHASKSYDPIPVKINLNAPIGIAHFGDPHVDDDGTDLKKLFEDAEIVNNTPGLFAGNIGDTQNNWIGRLQRLYGEQSTSAKESWQITEHFIKSVEWLYLIAGNHDCWSGAGDPIEWIAGDGTYTRHGSRLKLIFPNKREVVVNARHQWNGHSQWNTAHAISKAAQMGWDDSILVGGHTHVSGYQVVRNPSNGKISHCLQVASYKIHDRYAEEKGLNDKNIFNCPVTIINPFAEKETQLVHTIFDTKEASEYLCWIRSKYEN